MFSHFATFLPLAALVSVATAVPNALEARSICSTGTEYCCNQKFSNPTQFTGLLGGLLNVVVGATVDAGLTCDPITVVGVGSGGVCNEQTACCANNAVNGLVNIVCTPIAVNL